MFAIVVANFNLCAKGSDDVYRAIYELEEVYTYKADTWDPDFSEGDYDRKNRKDILRLELLPDKSFCYSLYTWNTDSIKKLPDGDRVWMRMFKAAYDKDEKGSEPSYPHHKNDFKIIKDHAKGVMTVYDFYDGEDFVYEDSIGGFEWNLVDSVAVIEGYECALATCSYHGRKWNVWFTTELPWQDGPWKFCGLPGLVVAANDSENLFKFRLTSIYKVDKPVKLWVSKPTKIARRKFLEDRFDYLKRLNGNLAVEFGIKVDASKRASRRYYVGLERDYDF